MGVLKQKKRENKRRKGVKKIKKTGGHEEKRMLGEMSDEK